MFILCLHIIQNISIYHKYRFYSLCHSLQEDFDRLQNWTVDMQMRVHPAKCRTMHLGETQPEYKIYPTYR